MDAQYNLVDLGPNYQRKYFYFKVIEFQFGFEGRERDVRLQSLLCFIHMIRFSDKYVEMIDSCKKNLQQIINRNDPQISIQLQQQQQQVKRKLFDILLNSNEKFFQIIKLFQENGEIWNTAYEVNFKIKQLIEVHNNKNAYVNFQDVIFFCQESSFYYIFIKHLDDIIKNTESQIPLKQQIQIIDDIIMDDDYQMTEFMG